MVSLLASIRHFVELQIEIDCLMLVGRVLCDRIVRFGGFFDCALI